MSTLTNAPGETEGEARVATVPWHAIAGLGPMLTGPLSAILDGTPAERVLDQTLRANRDLSAEQRTVVAESLFGVGLWRRRLRARHSANASPLELLATLIRDLGQRDQPLLEVSVFSLKALTNWRDRHSVPDWLAAELERAWGVNAGLAAAALNAPGPVCLRVNRLKINRADLAQRLNAEGVTTEPGRWSPEALIITSPRPNLYGLSASREALFEVQDEGSQLLGQLLDAQPGEQVLDLCAGAGGKSLQLAAYVAPTSRVHAFDLDRSRLDRLRQRAERAGAAIDIHIEPPTGMRFDRVLIDAPCSELGALRRGPDLRWRIDPASFADHALKGASLIAQGSALLKPGGHLVYATCTFRREENEDVVDAFLARHPGARRVSVDFKVAPHTHGTDGFYAARITSSVSGDRTA